MGNPMNPPIQSQPLSASPRDADVRLLFPHAHKNSLENAARLFHILYLDQYSLDFLLDNHATAISRPIIMPKITK